MIRRRSFIFFISLFLLNSLNAQNWNINTVENINEWNIHGLSRALSTSTGILGAGIPIGMATYAIIEKNQPLLEKSIYIGTSVIEAASIAYATKYITNKKRPYEKYPNKIKTYGASSKNGSSFPSGHAATAFSLATSISLTYPKWYIIAPSSLWACGVGIARINQGLHYPSDVIGGAAIGIGCGFANIYINKWLNRVLFNDKSMKIKKD